MIDNNDIYASNSNEENNQFIYELDQILAEIQGADKGTMASKAIEESKITGVPLAVCAHKYKQDLRDIKWWANPTDLNDDFINRDIDLIADYQNPLVDISKAIAEVVQFPLNTTYLFALGVLSSTTIKKFIYKSKHLTFKHAGLYVAAAQPPSTGKSPVTSYLTKPIFNAYKDLNRETEPARMVLANDIEKLEQEFKKCKVAGEQKQLANEIIDKREKLITLNKYEWGVSDATPEALEECAAKQEGRFSIVSDEAEAIAVVFGLYSQGNSNLGFVLKGFDGGDQKSLRLGRQGYSGEAIGSVAVLAQESMIAAILNTGRDSNGSRGVCERFLILNEPNIIHKKNYRLNKKMPSLIESNYKYLVQSIIDNTAEIVISFDDESIEFITQVMEGLQVHISDGGKFANELMRGIIGKAETQIYKIATTLHIAKEWSLGAQKSTIVQIAEVQAAARCYLQLIKSFVDFAEVEGIAGQILEMRVAAARLKSIINDFKKPRSQISHASFCDSIKNTKPFSKIPGLRKHVKQSLLPMLQTNGYIVFDEESSIIYINPKLKE